MSDSKTFQWADERQAHTMPTPAELEAAGFRRHTRHPRYPSSWLMVKEERVLIGINGLIGSGKDEIVNYLVRERGFVRLGMSDGLKKELASRLRLTVKRITIQDEVLGALPKLPDELRWHADRDGDEAWWMARLHYALWIERSPAIRALEQEYGTEVRRQDDGDYWVKLWRSAYVTSWTRAVVVPDVRFENEVREILLAGGRLVRVRRPGIQQGQHASERSLDHWTDWDQDIVNDGTIADLEQKVAEWLGVPAEAPAP